MRLAVRNILYASISFALVSWGVYNLTSAVTDAYLTINLNSQDVVYE